MTSGAEHMTVQTGVHVRIDSGELEGRLERDGAVFRGIPFAAPPFGERRFRYPEPPEPWEGVREAFESGPGAPQPLFPDDPMNTYFNPMELGEDCLKLDVWTPSTTAVGLP